MSAPHANETRTEKGDSVQEQSAAQERDTTAPRSTRFRFKSKSSRTSRSRREGDEYDDRRHTRHTHGHRSRSRSCDRESHRRRRSRDRGGSAPCSPIERSERKRHQHRRRHRHRHHHHHHHRSPPRAGEEEKEKETERDPFEEPPLSPETAFRESLFDALADDEGAAYWEAVYGQPIHIYAPPSSQSGGMLERMTDDEYAAYVRQKMWERTHAGLLEERARRQREREEQRTRREEQERVEREMETCLRRGEERRRKKAWRERWAAYVERWKEWEAGKGGRCAGGGGGGEVEGIPWPDGVDGAPKGGRRDVQPEAVRGFFVKGIGLEELGEKQFAARLKEERVKWHPDKMQQRLGGKVDETVMRDVTAIFQIVDSLWNEARKHSG